MYQIDERREALEIQAKYEELLEACKKIKTLTQQEEDDIFRAYSIANQAHAGTRRKSGEPYIFHPLAVALIAVKEVGLGPIAVICALLHDVVEDTDITLDQLRMVFGERVAVIVDGVTKIDDVTVLQQADSKQAENYRKILLSMCNDAYVIFLKLCDRLHNMRTLGSMKDTKKLAISSETQYLYIPLAHRLGLYTIKTELEELVMRYTNPIKYAEIEAKINLSAGTELLLKDCLTAPICKILDSHGYRYRIKTRIKSVYSCFKKMENKHVDFDEIYDLYAMRIILDVPKEMEKEECFRVYALISQQFPPNPNRFRDWITVPKSNGYESLQTTVMTPIGRWVEIQIRTDRMDNIAEKGMAAHFLYKEAHPEENIENNPVEEWLQQIRSTLENTDKSALDLVEEFKESLYTKEIYLFTPKGETVKLPFHSTVLDFAFAIHTDLGLHCIGAKVNAKVVPIGYRLHSGEQVQVLTSRNVNPSESWLEEVKTSRAKEHIKNYLREQRKVFHDQGKEMLMNYCKQLGIKMEYAAIKSKMKNYFGLTSGTDLYYQIVKGEIGSKEVSQCFGKAKASPSMFFLGPYRNMFEADDNDAQKLKNDPDGASALSSHLSPLNYEVDENYSDFEVMPAPCCKPVQGDTVVGIKDGDKIMIHRTNCKVAMDEMANHEDKIVRTKWREGEKVSFLTGIAFTAIDRKGLLQELTQVITQDMDLNMRALTIEASEGVCKGVVMLYVNNLDNINQLISNITSIVGVTNVRRV